MSFTRLYYDDCNYKKNLKEWTQPGNYVFGKPVMCEPCYPYMPSIRLQKKGNSTINPYLILLDPQLNVQVVYIIQYVMIVNVKVVRYADKE